MVERSGRMGMMVGRRPAGRRAEEGTVEFAILGLLLVRQDGRVHPVTAAKLRVLLGALLLRPNRPVPADTLIELLRADPAPAAARNTLRSYVMRLRRALPDGQRLRTSAEGYLLEVWPGELDAERFAELVDRARRAAADRTGADWPAVRRDTEHALALWRDQPLLDVPSAELQRQAVPRLEELRWQALELWAEAGLRLGEPAGVLARLRDALAADPLRERATALLMRALARCDRQAEALELYTATRKQLVAELGVEPGPALRAAQAEVLAGAAPENPPEHRSEHRPERPPEQPPVPARLPADLADFTGRGAELAAIRAHLEPATGATDRAPSPGVVRVVAVSGPAGAGKSALAVHAGHLLGPAYPGGQLYADLRGSQAAPRAAVEVVAGLLRALGERSLPADPEELTARLRARAGSRPLLVLLDDARDTAQVRPVLAALPGCGVLVTGRGRLSGLPGGRQLNLGRLPEADALDLLDATAGGHRLAEDPAAATAIVQACGHLPLAVRIAGARLASRPDWPVRALADRLAGPHRLAELTAGDLAVRASFALSYEQLDAPTAAAFRLLAASDSAELGLQAAAAVLDQPAGDTERQLDELLDHHLIESPAPGRYRYHDLLRLFAREVAGDVAGDVGSDQDGAAESLTRLFGYCFGTCYGVLRQLRPGLPAVLPFDPPGYARATAFDDPAAGLAWLAAEWDTLVAVGVQSAGLPAVQARWLASYVGALGDYADHRGLHAGWRRAAVAAAERAHRDSDGDAEAKLQICLAAIELRSGRPAAVEEHLRFALGHYALSADLPSRVRALTNAGPMYLELGRPAEAVQALRQALRLQQEHRHLSRRSELLVRNNLGLALNGAADHRSALSQLRRAAAIAAELEEPEVRGLVFNNLGAALAGCHRRAEAFESYRAGLAVSREVANPLSEAYALAGLGRLHRDSGRPDLALQHLERATATHEQVGSRRDRAGVLADLADLLAADGQSQRSADCRAEADRLLARIR